MADLHQPIEAEAFGRRYPCQLVYAGDVDEPPDPPNGLAEWNAWKAWDDGRRRFVVRLDWLGGPVGLTVPVVVTWSEGGWSAERAARVVGWLKACGYANVRTGCPEPPTDAEADAILCRPPTEATARLGRWVAEVRRLRAVVTGLTERVAAQSDILTRTAERAAP